MGKYTCTCGSEKKPSAPEGVYIRYYDVMAVMNPLWLAVSPVYPNSLVWLDTTSSFCKNSPQFHHVPETSDFNRAFNEVIDQRWATHCKCIFPCPKPGMCEVIYRVWGEFKTSRYNWFGQLIDGDPMGFYAEVEGPVGGVRIEPGYEFQIQTYARNDPYYVILTCGEPLQDQAVASGIYNQYGFRYEPRILKVERKDNLPDECVPKPLPSDPPPPPTIILPDYYYVMPPVPPPPPPPPCPPCPPCEPIVIKEVEVVEVVKQVKVKEVVTKYVTVTEVEVRVIKDTTEDDEMNCCNELKKAISDLTLEMRVALPTQTAVVLGAIGLAKVEATAETLAQTAALTALIQSVPPQVGINVGTQLAPIKAKLEVIDVKVRDISKDVTLIEQRTKLESTQVSSLICNHNEDGTVQAIEIASPIEVPSNQQALAKSLFGQMTKIQKELCKSDAKDQLPRVQLQSGESSYDERVFYVELDKNVRRVLLIITGEIPVSMSLYSTSATGEAQGKFGNIAICVEAPGGGWAQDSQPGWLWIRRNSYEIPVMDGRVRRAVRISLQPGLQWSLFDTGER